jgi:diaminohydroxyphosphoribosylaminopyrimidine deaminase / 5-amino-6-(5-phosphoribosylamino)uracil reductase
MQDAEWPWMQRALELAERGRGAVEPNPLVGAVVVRDGKALGEGWHERYGAAHAEVNALWAAAGDTRGATLYVTLEPCCHQGKTPPCTDAVVRAGITRVVAAMADPFPQVSGKGIAQLRAAGVSVDAGLGDREARRLNAPYLKLLSTGRPYVHAKWAMTLDGKIATATGESKWISGEASRRRVHDLRGRVDAILVGAGTVRADDPLLTARPPGPRVATRIVLSRSGLLPAGARLVQTAREIPLLVVTLSSGARTASLREAGCEVLHLATREAADVVPLLLDELGRRRMTNILVEGGSGALGAFLDARAIDELHVFVAPNLLGGERSLSPIAGRGEEKIAQALRLAEWHIEPLGEDFYIHGTLSPFPPGENVGET